MYFVENRFGFNINALCRRIRKLTSDLYHLCVNTFLIRSEIRTNKVYFLFYSFCGVTHREEVLEVCNCCWLLLCSLINLSLKKGVHCTVCEFSSGKFGMYLCLYMHVLLAIFFILYCIALFVCKASFIRLNTQCIWTSVSRVMSFL